MILSQMPVDCDSLRMTDRQIDCNRTPSALRERFAAPNNELVSTALALVYTQEPVALLFCIPLVVRTQDFGQHSYNNPSPGRTG